jgi:hypothetical protein
LIIRVHAPGANAFSRGEVIGKGRTLSCVARPFQRIEDRLAGRPLDQTLHDGVPAWLDRPFRDWLDNCADESLAFEVALRLRLSLRPEDREEYQTRLYNCTHDELLAVVDAVLQLHPGGDDPWRTPNLFQGLEYVLTNGGSMYKVDREKRHLVRRVDETVEAAAEAAMKSASKTAGDHLREAWLAAYGLTPDPDKVFNEAIRAVEEVACPLVEEKRADSNTSTLGSVIGALRSAPHKWELVLHGQDGSPRDPASLIGMMDTLWKAQYSRHGGGSNSRRQSQEEAEAAVHLAAVLVQWLSTGVLRKTP